MKYLHEKLTNNSLKERISFTIILFLIMFLGVMIASYYLLPEGLLKNKTRCRVGKHPAIILS